MVSSLSAKWVRRQTMLQCRSKAFTLPSSFLLLRTLMRTCVLYLTLSTRTDIGPLANLSSSVSWFSSGVVMLREAPSAGSKAPKANKRGLKKRGVAKTLKAEGRAWEQQTHQERHWVQMKTGREQEQLQQSLQKKKKVNKKRTSASLSSW